MIDVTEQKRKIAVIGGGITGLTAAFYLQEQARLHHYPLEIVLIEGSHRLGGKLQTLRKDGFIIDRGPSSFRDPKGIVAQLAKQLHIEHEIVTTTNAKTFIAIDKDLQQVPQNTIMGIPTKFKPFMASELVSWSGKVRATADLIIPPSNVDGDQSLGKFVRRRFGEEFVQSLIEPLLSGVYSGDIDELSLQSTLPSLLRYEQKRGSVIRGMRHEMKSSEPGDFTVRHNSKNVQKFKGGMSTLIHALTDELSDCQILKSVKVQSITPFQDKTCLSLNNKSTLLVDGVIVATPLHTVTKLFKEEEIQQLQTVPCNTVATVTMIFKENSLRTFDGTDVYISRNSDYSFTSVTFEHKKWPFIAPEGYAVVNCYIGRTGDAAIVDLSDSEIEKALLEDFQQLFGLQQLPLETIVSRWKDSMPQYTIGHAERVKKAKDTLQQLYPTIRLAGNSYNGISIPKCIKQGKRSADQLLCELFERTPQLTD